jgi:L-alanine-DL-glutamate epimerase-like enolase superfamily enzyme
VSALRIRGVEAVDIRDGEPEGDDTVFVAVHAGCGTGWYGPVSNAIGDYACRVLAPELAGVDATDVREVQRRLRGKPGTPHATCASWAAGAIDCALWDLRSKLANLRVAALMMWHGLRSSIPAYASWLTHELRADTDAAAIAQVAEAGWVFTKWGLRADPRLGPAAQADLLAQAVHRAAGSTATPLAVDAVGTWTPALTLGFAHRVDPGALIWLEDPLPRHDVDLYRQVAARLPIAWGERLRLGEDPAPLMAAARPVALTLDVVGCGGLTRAAEIVAAARARGVPVYPHGRSLIPGMHLAAAFPATVPAVEFRLQWEPARQLLYAQPCLPEHGLLTLPDTPGLGTTPRSAPCPAHR